MNLLQNCNVTILCMVLQRMSKYKETLKDKERTKKKHCFLLPKPARARFHSE